MRRSASLTIIVSACMMFAWGCATETSSQAQAPAKDTRPVEERLRVGMTKEEVRGALGEPAGKSMTNTGVEQWRYSDSAKAFIPFYAISGGKFQHVIINFDADGKVKDWSTSTQGMF